MSAPPRQPPRCSHDVGSPTITTAVSAGSKRRACDSPASGASTMTDNVSAAAVALLSPAQPVAVTSADDPAAAAASTMPSGTAHMRRKRARLSVPKQAASPPLVLLASRWASMYSDALHSIFKFASLTDLARLMSVSRRWGEAVMTMPPIATPVYLWNSACVDDVFASRVRRHQWTQSKDELFKLSGEQLERASMQVPWLRGVAAKRLIIDGCSVCAALPRFTNLRQLDIELHPSMQARVSNRVIQTIGGLNPATMKTLTMVLWFHSDEMSFKPLAALTQLRTLSLDFVGLPSLTDAQIGELRALTSVKQLNSPYHGEAETNFLTRMLQPDHQLQWTTIGSFGGFRIEVTAPLAAVLGSLPTLTSLRAGIRCADVQFLAQLSQLTDLELDGRDSGMDSAALVSSLRHCSQLTRLTLLFASVTSRHMEELLPAFPLLSTLNPLSLGELDSLRCFATPALGASLTSLHLSMLRRCPPRELGHLFGLRALQSVTVERLADPLTRDQKVDFCVRSQRFPVLRHCSIY